MSTTQALIDETGRPDECSCSPRSEVEGVELIPRFPCCNAGFDTPNPDAGDDE